jgi:hypothetical protein
VTVNSDGSLVYKPAKDFSGTDSFGYRISDGHGGVAVATATVRVVSAAEQLGNLIMEINNLFTAGALNKGLFNSLTTQLQGPLDFLNKGKADVADNRLVAFINHVQSLISDGVLTDAQGDPLVSAALAVLASIRK